MKKMTPREALYNICVELGPMPQTNRDDNLTAKEVRLRDSVRTLQNFILYHDDSTREVPKTANEYIHQDDYIPKPSRASVRGSGKDRIETWKKEAGHGTRPSRLLGETPSHLQFGPDGNDA